MRGSTRTFHWCGAVIISSSHLLTAAHCLEDYPKESYVVRVGDWDQDVEDIDEQEFSIAAVHFHPEYNVGAYLNNDLAVVTTKEEARLGSRVVPVCLPAPATSYTPGTQCTISGWGSTGQASGGYSRRLQAAVVPILETRRCMEKQVYGPDKLTSGMVCAGAGVIISSYD